MKRAFTIIIGLLVAAALFGAGLLIGKARSSAAVAASPFKLVKPGEPLPAVPPPPKGKVTLTRPDVGDKDSVIERYRPAFHAMGYEIGFERAGVVDGKVQYHWWAAKRFEEQALLPRLGGVGFEGNPYGQPESEAAAKRLLDRVKQAEGRK